MRGTCLLLAALCLVSSAASAAGGPAAASAGGGWDQTFRAETLGSYLGTAKASVLVVGAGQVTPELSAATTALGAAFRASGRSKLVMTPESLGDVSTLDDGAIVQKAKHLPIDLVAVLRIFPGAAGEPPTAVVAVYGKDGKPTSGFSVTRGTSVAASDTTYSAGQGASSQAVATAVSTIGGGTEEPPSAAQRQYEDNYIGTNEVLFVSRYGAGIFSSFYHGKMHKPIEGPEFYEIIGRRDLLDKYHNKNAKRWTVGIIGAGATVVGTVLLIAGIGKDCNNWDEDPTFNESGCKTNQTTMVTSGLVLMLGGLIMAPIGAAMSPHPISNDEAKALAQQYNEDLKKKLGLPKDYEVASREEPKPAPKPTWHAGLTFGRSGGMLAFGLRF